MYKNKDKKLTKQHKEKTNAHFKINAVKTRFDCRLSV